MTRVRDIVRKAIHDEPTHQKMLAERTFLARMGGSCQTPLAAHAIDCPSGMRVDRHVRHARRHAHPEGRARRADRQAAQLGTELGDD